MSSLPAISSPAMGYFPSTQATAVNFLNTSLKVKSRKSRKATLKRDWLQAAMAFLPMRADVKYQKPVVACALANGTFQGKFNRTFNGKPTGKIRGISNRQSNRHMKDCSNTQSNELEVYETADFSVLQSQILAWISQYQILCKHTPTVEQVLWHSPFDDGVPLRHAIASLFIAGWLVIPFEQAETRLTVFGKSLLNHLEGLPWGAQEGVFCQLNAVPVTEVHASSGRARNLETVGRLQLPHRLFHCKPDFLLRFRDDSLRSAQIKTGDLGAFVRRSFAHEGQLVLMRLADKLTVCRMGARQADDFVLLHRECGTQASLRIKTADCQVEGILIGVVRA